MRTGSWLVLALALVGCPADELLDDDSAAGDDDDIDQPVGIPVTVWDEQWAWPSYTLYSGRYTEQAHLLDMTGAVVHTWSYPQGLTWCYAELLEDGTLVVIVKEQEDQFDGMLFELDWDSNLLRTMTVPAHHDFVRRENGNTLVLAREYVTNDAIRAGSLKSDFLVELTPDDEVVWEWHADEHVDKLDQLVDLELPADDRDWAHTNTVEVLPASPAGDADERFAEGNVMFSMCNQDTIGVIDPDTDEVLWAWGPGETEGQHMPTMLDNGHLLIYDNGSTREWSRIIELDPLTEEIVWSYPADGEGDFYSRIHGGNQRLPNGNTFVSDSDNDRLFEVTPIGDIVWEWVTWEWNHDDDEIMRIYRSQKLDAEWVEARL